MQPMYGVITQCIRKILYVCLLRLPYVLSGVSLLLISNGCDTSRDVATRGFVTEEVDINGHLFAAVHAEHTQRNRSEMGPIFVYRALQGQRPEFIGHDDVNGGYFLRYGDGKKMYVPDRGVVLYRRDREEATVLVTEWDPRCADDKAFRLDYIKKLLLEKAPDLLK